jgi:hypothetical protein
VLDLRTPKEFTTGYLEGAVNMDFRGENFTEELEKGERRKNILFTVDQVLDPLKQWL